MARAAHPVGQRFHGDFPARGLAQQFRGIGADPGAAIQALQADDAIGATACQTPALPRDRRRQRHLVKRALLAPVDRATAAPALVARSEEHTSELQSLMRTSYAVSRSNT